MMGVQRLRRSLIINLGLTSQSDFVKFTNFPRLCTQRNFAVRSYYIKNLEVYCWRPYAYCKVNTRSVVHCTLDISRPIFHGTHNRHTIARPSVELWCVFCECKVRTMFFPCYWCYTVLRYIESRLYKLPQTQLYTEAYWYHIGEGF